MYQKNSKARYIIIILVDCICTIMAMIGAFYIRYGERAKTLYVDNYFVQFLALAITVYIFVKLLLGIDYRFYINGYLVEALHVLRNNILCFAGITVAMYIFKWGESYSRLAVFYFLILNSILMYVMHIVLKKVIPILYDRFAETNRMLIISEYEWLEDIVSNIYEMKDFGNKIIGVVIADRESNKKVLADYKEVAKLDEVVDYCQQGYLDEVVVAVSRARRKEILPIMDAISEMGITVHYHVNFPDLSGAKHKTLNKMGNYYMMTYATRIVSGWELIIKRVMDVVGALIGCILLLLMTLIIGPLIKMESKGPIFFSQKRVGRNGRYFMMYKFRSMYIDAEEKKEDLLKENEMDGFMFKMENDPRITKIGKFIRKTSIDEFPQFWNVLKGDMSLVGTRPPTIDEFKNYSPYHKKRLSFRPGITGLWQVSGRNEISDFDKVVSLDVEYIDNWSPWLDLKIIIKTIGKMFTGK